MRIVRKSSLIPVPWKNGGGVTHEVWREPASGDQFGWRVSIAHIAVDGPFSLFPGVNRTMVLLRGDGLTLTFEEGRREQLRSPGDLVVFDGANSLHCALLGGRCIDLNLMVARSAVESRSWVAGLAVPVRIESASRGTTLIFPIIGGVMLEHDSNDGGPLGEWDMAVVGPGEAVTVSSAAHGTHPLVFFAALT